MALVAAGPQLYVPAYFNDTRGRCVSHETHRPLCFRNSAADQL